MADKKERFENLVEELKSDFRAVAEGHSILDRKIDAKFEEVQEDLDIIKQAVKEISRDLKVHIRQTVPPAHVSV